MISIRWWGLVMAATIGSCACAIEPRQVEVHMIVAKDLPALVPDRINRVLRRAEVILQDVCDVKVRFLIPRIQDADVFLAAHRTRLAPYRLPSEYSLNPFEVTAEGLSQRVAERLSGQREFAALRAAMPDATNPITDAATAARALSEQYVNGLTRIRGLRMTDGEALLRPLDWTRYSIAHWGVYLHSADWTDTYTLYLTNVLLFDDLLSGPPEQLALGPTVNGCSLPASRSALVTYFGVLSGELSAGNARLSGMTDEEKDAAIAYLIAQNVGVFLLLGRDASYDDEGGLARPMAILPKKADFADMRRLALAKAGAAARPSIGSYTFKVLLRMDVFAAQEAWSRVLEESDRGNDPLFDVAQLRQLELRIERARRRVVH